MRKIFTSLALSISFFLLFGSIATAQIVVAPAQTANALANKLIGGGVSITSPVLTCHDSANGIFVGVSTVGFDSGVVLTSGRSFSRPSTFAYGADGPASNFASTSWSLPGDPQLTALAGQPTFDRCILEFDFRPTGDTIKFNYVFGSEEYTSFACSNFNDVFGFFVSGPGFATPTNIALVPGTTIPVCINSVNCGPTGGGSLTTCSSLGAGSPFCAYYVNNSAGTTITYDGLTTRLTAIAHVTACEVYHLKIGVADGTDHSYDSGVFLEAGSLSSTGISVNSSGLTSTDTTQGPYCVRGCTTGQFVFHISSPQTSDYVIHYTTGGTAINGVDYATIIDSVIIPAGGISAVVVINPLTTSSGHVQVQLYVQTTFSCGGSSGGVDTVTMDIFDPIHVNILTPDTTICLGGSLNPVLGPLAVLPPGDSYYFSWTPGTVITGASTASPTITPTASGDFTYTITLTDAASSCTATDTIRVHVAPNDFVLQNPDSTICFSALIPIRLSGSSEFTYHWEPAAFLDNPNIPTPNANIAADVTLTVTASFPGCPDVAHSVTFTVEAPHVDIRTGDTAVCKGESVLLDVISTPPSLPVTQVWSPTTNLTNSTTLTPTFSSTVVGDYPYTVTITSPNGCVSSDMVTISIRPPAYIAVTPANTMVAYGTEVQLNAENLTPYPLVFYWTPNDGSLTNPNINNPVATMHDSTTFVCYAMNQWGCRDSASVTILVDDGSSEFAPSAFTPNGDGLNDVFRMRNMRYQKLVLFEVYNRWGQRVYENNNSNESNKGWDGTFEGVAVDMGVYNYQIIVAKPDGSQKMYKGQVTLIR
jgi:gliding motility-associated-like protein